MGVIYGEVGQVFSPLQITGCTLWLDAQDVSTITRDGSNLVSQWNDKSTSGLNMAQATGSFQPTFTTSGINGKSAIDFDGTDNFLKNGTAGGGLTGTSGEVWMVYLLDSVAGACAGLASSDEATDNNFIVLQPLRNGTDLNVQINSNNAGTANAARGDTVEATATCYITRFKTDGTTWSMGVSGVTQTLTIVAGSNTGDWWGDIAGRDNLTIGALVRNASPNGEIFMNGKIGEIIAYNNSFNDSKSITLFNYLLSKWGPA